MTPKGVYVPDMRRLSLQATAYHEAGHALSAVVHRLRFSAVWILQRKETDTFPAGTIIGQVRRTEDVHKPSYKGRLDDAKVEAVQAMAGPVAECLPFPGMQPNWVLNESDMKEAVSFLKFALLPFTLSENGADFAEEDVKRAAGQINSLLQECYERSVALVSGNMPAIDRVAQALLARWSLTEDEVRILISRPQ